MRPKLIIVALLMATVVLAVVGLLTKSSTLPPGDAGAAQQAAPAPATARATSAPSAADNHTPASIAAAPSIAPLPANPADHEKYVQQRSAQLMELAMNNDQQSLNTILSEMTNTDKDIRKAALQAAVQFDDPSAVPRLKEIASQTDDPDEKKAIFDAADYLSLPSLTDYLKQHPGNRVAAARGVAAPFQAPAQNPPAQ